MPPVRLSKSAERWFLSKVAEIAEVNPAAARKLIERLERQKDLLSSFPQMTEKGILEGTRKVSMPPLVLTIRARNGIVEIAAIRDARQKDAYTPAELVSPTTTMMTTTKRMRIAAAQSRALDLTHVVNE